MSDTEVTPTRPIDDVVADLIGTIRHKDRGFVLSLSPAGEKVVIEVKESLAPHDEWEPPVPYRSHKIEDTGSFIAYAERYGNKDESLVFYSDTGATLCISEETPATPQRELVTMAFAESADWRDWSGIIGKELNHKTLLMFLMAHSDTLLTADALRSMQSMKLNSTVNIESDIKDDGKTVGIVVKTTAGEDLKKFPKEFDIVLPVLDQDTTEKGTFAKATIRLNTELPDDPKHGPCFTLFCPTWRQIKRGRIDAEGAKIRDALDGWAVVHGQHQQTPRRIGGK